MPGAELVAEDIKVGTVRENINPLVVIASPNLTPHPVLLYLDPVLLTG